MNHTIASSPASAGEEKRRAIKTFGVLPQFAAIYS